jgi:hypothetical protein
MDADILLPEEGNALLTEIAALDEAIHLVAPERGTVNCEPLLRTLEALVQTDRLDAETEQQARAIVRQMLATGTNERA